MVCTGKRDVAVFGKPRDGMLYRGLIDITLIPVLASLETGWGLADGVGTRLRIVRVRLCGERRR